MNAKLGFLKKVNIILVKFDSPDSMMGEYLRSYWKGGKKNDLVLCVGEGWTRVFSWSDADVCKKNLETILLNNKLDKKILPKIEKEIKDNFTKTNWKKFDHIQKPVATWVIVVYFIVTCLIQGGLFYWFHHNELSFGNRF